jgi:tetratricopeptide (TPR) repeat protein
MNRRVLLLACALCSPLTAQNAAMDQGVELIREGHFDQALPRLEEAHRLSPRNPTIENLLGIAETKLGHIDAADNHYRAAIALDPSQAAPHRNLGFNLLTAKKFDAAAPELRAASRLDPKDPFAHYYLLCLALTTGREADAVAQAPQARPLVENDPETAAELVEAEIRMAHNDDAAALVSRLEQSGQLSPEREYSIATLFAQHSSYPQAVSCFRRIALANPVWQNRFNLALALLYDNQPAEAASILAALHTELPGNADILTFLGSADEMLEKLPEALEAYRAAAANDPSNPDRMLDYTRVLMDTDRYDEAIQVVESGLGTAAQTAPFELRLGALEMIKGNYDSARDAFRAALKTDPELDVAYVGLAETYSRQANDRDAIQILESDRQARPDHYLLEYYFGMLASRLGREKDALAALNNAARLEPGSADPQFELGKLYVSQEDWPEARQAFERVIAIRPQFAPAHYQLSRVCTRLGISAEAAHEAQLAHTLVDAQRDQAFRNQRARGGSFRLEAPDTTLKR